MSKIVLGTELFTVRECAELLQVAYRTVQNYIREGRLKGQKIGGRWYFSREELERFLKGE